MSDPSCDALHGVFLPGGEIPGLDVRAGLPDHVEVEGEVVLAREHRREHLAGHEQVVQVGFCIEGVYA